MELRIYPVWRAFSAWLLDAAFQLITDGFIPALKSRTPNVRASSVWSDLSTTFSFASCTEPSNDQIMARAAMLESSSCDIPMPIGIWISGCIARIGHVVVAEAEPPLGDRVVGTALAEVEDGSVPPLGLLHHVRHVERLRLERARGREELEQVVSLLRRHFCVGTRDELGEVDVIHGDLDTLARAPILGVLVEPHVVGGDEVAPLQDLERLLLALDPNGGQGECCRRPGRGGHEGAPIHPLPPFRHGSTLRLERNGPERSGCSARGPGSRQIVYSMLKAS